MILLNRISVTPSFCFGICVSLFLLPIKWMIAWFAAALIHECGHLLALRILKVNVVDISLDFKGALIKTAYTSGGSEIISALAGPLAGLCCVLFSSVWAELAICAFAQSVYNLLPYSGFDGGRALRGFLSLFLSGDTAGLIFKWVNYIVTGCILILGIYLSAMAGLGIIAFLICFIPVLKSGIIKIPCKQRKQIVQ